MGSKEEADQRVGANTKGGQTIEAPRCVCGATLSRCSAMERTMLWLESCFPQQQRTSPRFRQALEAVISEDGRTRITCDICEEQVLLRSAVWHCTSGSTTMLHATEFDVCDECFVQHAFLRN